MIVESLPEGSHDAEDAVTRRILRVFDEADAAEIMRSGVPSDALPRRIGRFLDAGCGEGKYILRLRARRPHLRAWAVEGHAPSLRETSADKKILGMLPDALRDVSNDAVDAAIAIDVIEHLEKPASLELLRHLERVARRCVALFTPLGFMEHPGTDANPLLRHLSGWEPAELEALGYQTAVWEVFDYGLGVVHPALWAWKVKP